MKNIIEKTKLRCTICNGEIVFRLVHETSTFRLKDVWKDDSSLRVDSCYCSGCGVAYDRTTIEGRMGK